MNRIFAVAIFALLAATTPARADCTASGKATTLGSCSTAGLIT